MNWLKPSYCSRRELDCDKCELFRDGECALTEEHMRILEEADRRG